MRLTWDDVGTLEDLDFLKVREEKDIIRELEGTSMTMCPFLRKVGDFSYFCGLAEVKDGKGEPVSEDMYGLLLEQEMGPFNMIYGSLQEVSSLSLYCFGDWKLCGYFNGSLRSPLKQQAMLMAVKDK